MLAEPRADRQADPQADPQADAITDALAAHRHRPGALLPVLHAVQHALGWIPPAAVPQIARVLALSSAEVDGVIGFHDDFTTRPAGRHRVRICVAEACHARGARAVLDAARTALECGIDETRPDGEVTLETVHCLGLCATGPAIEVDGRALGRVSPGRIAEIARTPGPRRTDRAHAGAGPAIAAPEASRRIRVYVPADTAATAVGADEVAAALAQACSARGIAPRIVRTGSRGLAWLEPLVEIETEAGRIGYGPVAPSDLPGLLDAGFLAGGAHPLRQGRIEDLPWLARQRRLVFARCGVVDPLNPDDYAGLGGWTGLRKALRMPSAAIVDAITASGLRGRGGAAFPTGIKWRTVLDAPADRKYVVCNADEGDSGAFADRMLLEGDPFGVLEGMAICGLAVGATLGFVYVRSEYPRAVAAMESAAAAARAAGFLGPDLLGSGRAFDVEIRKGAGAYICGEETALLESLEGRRGVVRSKPPLPAVSGLFGRPTVVNNVVTLATVTRVLADGAAAHRDLGVGRSRGTMPFQLAGNVLRGGLVEVPFGVTLRELVEDFGGGTRSGRPVKAIQVGGPLGAYVPPRHWDLPLDYEDCAAAGIVVGHGSVVVHDDTANLAALARHAMAFCARESCGKCTPCRIGSVRGVEVIDRIVGSVRGVEVLDRIVAGAREVEVLDRIAAGGRDSEVVDRAADVHGIEPVDRAADVRGIEPVDPPVPDPSRDREVALLRNLCETMLHGSLCAMGGMTPFPVLSALDHYPADFGLDRSEDAGEPQRRTGGPG